MHPYTYFYYFFLLSVLSHDVILNTYNHVNQCNRNCSYCLSASLPLINLSHVSMTGFCKSQKISNKPLYTIAFYKLDKLRYNFQ